MYDEISFLGPSDPHSMLIGSLGVAAASPPSVFSSTLGCNGSNLSIIPGPSFSYELADTTAAAAAATTTTICGLSLNGQLGFDPKHELDGFQHCFIPPAAFSDPAVIPMPSSISFNYTTRGATVSFQTQAADVYEELTVGGHGSAGGFLYDHHQQQQPPLINDVLHSLPHEIGSFGGGILGNCNGMVMDDCSLNPVFGLWKEMGGGRCGGRGKTKVGNSTERHRRGKMSEKFQALKDLIPSPTKTDKASILLDAANYIKELLRRVEELKTLVTRKRLGGGGGMRRKFQQQEQEQQTLAEHDDPVVEVDNTTADGLLRSSWLQRRSKETTVDVRIVEDEATIKITQRKKPGCLLLVANVLYDLQLELIHLSSGNIGGFIVFMVNTKIHEGSIVYASGIAQKLIDAMSFQYSVFFD